MSNNKVQLYSPQYFALCGVGGILSCGITHTAVTPIDLVKCNAQANPKKFNRGMFGNMGLIRAEEGLRGLGRGWAPTAIGYSLQGLGKFGLYEVFKHKYGNWAPSIKEKYPALLHMSASASAEFFADIMLCPFEAVKVRVQTQPTFAKTLSTGMPKMISEEGFGALFKGIGPLWARQIPYTIIKFVAFEKIVSIIYSHLSKPKEDYSKAEQLGITFLAGYSAGVICGAVSHPADTMVSKLYKAKTDASTGTWQIVKQIYHGTPDQPGIGFRGLWAGFGPRVVMIGTLTALQWFIYDSFKVAMNFPTTGGAQKK